MTRTPRPGAYIKGDGTIFSTIRKDGRLKWIGSFPTTREASIAWLREKIQILEKELELLRKNLKELEDGC